MRSFLAGALLATLSLTPASAQETGVTVDFSFDPALVEGIYTEYPVYDTIDRLIFRGNLSFDFTVAENGDVTMSAGLSNLNEAELTTSSDLVQIIVESWGGVVGSVDPSFAGEEFAISMLNNPDPAVPYETYYVLDHTGGASGSLGIYTVDEDALETVWDNAEGGSNDRSAVAHEWLLNDAGDDVILNTPAGAPGASLQEDSERIYFGVDQFDFAYDSTSFQLTELTYASASGPDPHIVVSDIGGQSEKQVLTGTDGTVDLSSQKFWTNNVLSSFGGFQQMWLETEADAAEDDGAALSSFTFDLVPYYAGDLNRDLVLDEADVELLIEGWRTDTTGMDYYEALLLGDINFDNTVDYDDWFLMRDSFLGADIELPFGLTSVPEPAGALLLAIAAPLAATRRRRGVAGNPRR